MAEKAGVKMSKLGRKCIGNHLWFDEKCVEGNRESREASKDFKEKNETSRIKYWERRNMYERNVENKKAV